MLRSYVKIFPAAGRWADYFVGQHVEITEKLDGSQFCFGKDPDGTLFMRSKGAPLYWEEKIESLFKPAVLHVLSVQDRIPNDTAYYAETLSTPRHNTLRYNRVPKNHISLYGITDFARTRNIEALEEEAAALEVERVPVLFLGVLKSLEEFKDYLALESVLGGPKIEGVVAKNYAQTLMLDGPGYFPLVAMKYVSEEFKEAHADNPEYVPRTQSIETLLECYRTEARWRKSIQHTRESGALTESPRDIGSLIPAIQQDIEAEEKENIKEALWHLYRKDLMRTAVRGFPEFYKSWLLTTADTAETA